VDFAPNPGRAAPDPGLDAREELASVKSELLHAHGAKAVTDAGGSQLLPSSVIPAKAGIQRQLPELDSRLRGNDDMVGEEEGEVMLLENLETGRAPMDMGDLAGKVAVVTGAASGIGLALARRLKAEGMELVLADLDREALEGAEAELGAFAMPADIRDPQSVRALADAALAHFGAVHLLCSNAGVSRMAGIERLTIEDWRWLFDVNLFGAVNAIEAFLPLLKANSEGGHVLFTASLSSFYPTRAQAAYGATKYALAALGETLALELQAEGAKVGVTLLCPGPVRTNIAAGYARREDRYRAGAAGEGRSPDMHEQAFRGAIEESDWSTPEEAAEAALAGMRRGELWAITHSRLMSAALARNRAIAEASERGGG